MKLSINIAAIVSGVLIIFVSAAFVSAQDTISVSLLRNINQQLAEAGVPLSERQIYNLRNLEYSDNLRGDIYALLTDEQITVLTGKSSQTDITSTIRRINQQLAEAGVPLSERQIYNLRNLENSDNLRGDIYALLTDEQITVLTGKSSQTDITSTIRRINQQLAEAGVPLSERQIYNLRNLENSDNLRGDIYALLTDEQITVLTGKSSQTDITSAIRRINQQLAEADVPLSERQIYNLRNLENSDNLRRDIYALLTDEQIDVLTSQHGEEYTDVDLLNPTDVDQQPEVFDVLNQNYPNPFNPFTTITYDLTEPSNVTVEVFDNNGRLVDRLVNEYQTTGSHVVAWDASSYAAGIYFYRITAGTFNDIKKMSFIK